MDWAGAGAVSALLAGTYVLGYACVGLMLAQGTVALTRRQFTRTRTDPLFRPALLGAMRSPVFWRAYWIWWGAAVANTVLPLLYVFTMPAAAALGIFVVGALFNVPLAIFRLWLWRFWTGSGVSTGVLGA